MLAQKLDGDVARAIVGGLALGLFTCAVGIAEAATSGNVELPKYAQRTVCQEGLIKAPASATWAAITEWGGIMKWWHSVPDTPIYPLLECPLLPQENERQIPRTRRCRLDMTKVAGLRFPEIDDPHFVPPETTEETLIAQDDRARYLVYEYEKTFHPGSTTIQVVSEGPCLSRFIIKYTNLDDVNAAHYKKISAQENIVGDAFGPKGDYRGVKYLLEKQWAGKAPCS